MNSENLFRWCRSSLSPLLVLFCSAVIWELAVRGFGIRPFLLPAPSTIFMDLFSRPGWYLRHAQTTLLETVSGFFCAVLLGFLISVGVIYSRIVEKTVYTLLVTLNAIPKIALAPLFIIWLGTEMAPKVAIGITLALFPIVISTVLGLRTVEPDMLDLSRSMGASRLQVLLKIRLPSAMPSIFSGLKVAITLAFSGALVGEFIASQHGLGYLIVSAQANFDTTPMFASIVFLALIGTVLFFLIELLEHSMLGWHVSKRRGDAPVLV